MGRAGEARPECMKIWEYKPAGRDIWGRQVWAAYFLGSFAGYRYRRTRREMDRLRKKYGRLVGIREWIDCPEWCLAKNGVEAPHLLA
ncbi:MAG: hypothetical protein ACPLTR_10920 [Thermacetogeniaceae bacterium]